MNDDKTEFLFISSKSIACGIVSPSLHIGDNQVVATSNARNIGVMMDSKASMEAHVLSVVIYLHSQPELDQEVSGQLFH